MESLVLPVQPAFGFIYQNFGTKAQLFMQVDSNQNTSGSTDDTHSLLFETSPFGTVDAIVEHDHRTVYFYLNGKKPFGMRACWVRNLEAGPLVLNQGDMKHGRPPLLPRTHVSPPGNQEIPNPDDLKIVWFEEGNAAALSENGRTIAVIPPWSGTDKFHGYAAECALESDLCWPLPKNRLLEERISRAAAFWNSLRDESSQPFQILQPEVLEKLTDRFGGEHIESKYFSIDGGQFPPRGLVVFRDNESVIAITVAMSFVPQPNVEIAVESPTNQQRIELGIQLKTNKSIEELNELWSELSSIASYPWRAHSWLGNHHTFDFKFLATHLGGDFAHIGFVADPDPLTTFRRAPVNVLWLAPLTRNERQKLASGDTNFESLGMKDRIQIDIRQ